MIDLWIAFNFMYNTQYHILWLIKTCQNNFVYSWKLSPKFWAGSFWAGILTIYILYITVLVHRAELSYKVSWSNSDHRFFFFESMPFTTQIEFWKKFDIIWKVVTYMHVGYVVSEFGVRAVRGKAVLARYRIKTNFNA